MTDELGLRAGDGDDPAEAEGVDERDDLDEPDEVEVEEPDDVDELGDRDGLDESDEVETTRAPFSRSCAGGAAQEREGLVFRRAQA